MTRRTIGTVLALALTALLAGLVAMALDQAVRHPGLPLSDTAIIRRQASEKHLDPALIAAVIYAETKFEPRPSAAGAEGLMQILPETAYYLARLSGGTSFTAARYLLDHYNGNEMLAVAAYNGGLTNVDRWVAEASAAGRPLTIGAIPFPETREYVQRVLSAQQAYRQTYARELGLQ
jgi:soluble lytic murein transglycosylase